MALERLQKLLARAGIASRRRAEDLIVAGRVSVDGQVVSELGARADTRRSRVEVDGRRIVSEDFVYGVLHKPRGTVCTLRDPEGRETVRDLLRGVGARVVPVGRLDYHTSGVLLFTNDGEFASTLQHAKTKAPKVYVAKLRGLVGDQALERLRDSIVIDGRQTRPAAARVLRREGDKTWVEFTLEEGRNRQIRRLGDHANSPVLRLARIAHAGITAEGLRPGTWRLLSVDELVKLKKQYGVPKRVRRPHAPAGGGRGAGRKGTERPERRATAPSGRPSRARTRAGGARQGRSAPGPGSAPLGTTRPSKKKRRR
jgi:23S rRNA pseudouridine2605 synthase